MRLFFSLGILMRCPHSRIANASDAIRLHGRSFVDSLWVGNMYLYSNGNDDDVDGTTRYGGARPPMRVAHNYKVNFFFSYFRFGPFWFAHIKSVWDWAAAHISLDREKKKVKLPDQSIRVYGIGGWKKKTADKFRWYCVSQMIFGAKCSMQEYIRKTHNLMRDSVFSLLLLLMFLFRNDLRVSEFPKAIWSHQTSIELYTANVRAKCIFRLWRCDCA